MKKNILYAIGCLSFAIMIGGAVYEHINIVPTWSAAPPLSLSMFQGQYGLNPELFWMIIHPVNIFLLITMLILQWRSARRKNIIIVLSSYVIILIITSVYFVPELISITKTAFSRITETELTRRASRWEMLSLVRLFLLLTLSILLFTGLTKPNELAVTTAKHS